MMQSFPSVPKDYQLQAITCTSISHWLALLPNLNPVLRNRGGMKTTSTSHSYVPWREKSWSSRFIHSSPVCSILLPQVALLLKSRTPPATSHHTREQSLTLPGLDQGPSTRSSRPGGLDWTGRSCCCQLCIRS